MGKRQVGVDQEELIKNRRQSLEKSTKKCPYCGAQAVIDPKESTGICPYCGAVLKADDKD